jgi:nitrite reductase/ring-hydroxylating ferredoxin subunit
MTDSKDSARPDLASGVSIRALADGEMLLGRVGEDDVLLARAGDSIFAVGAHCTHYRGQLADGLLVGETVRCPLHHACFDLRTGEALRAPALDPISCWRVERDGDTVVVREKKPATESARASKVPASRPASVGIVGGGAAAIAAAVGRSAASDGLAQILLRVPENAPSDRVVPAFGLGCPGIAAIARKEADGVADSPRAAKPAVDGDTRIPTGRQYARCKRAIDEIEIGLAGDLFVSEWQLEVTGLDVDRFCEACPRVHIPPRGFLAQADRRFEILTEFSRDLERDPLERGPLHADATVLPFRLHRIETQ